MTQQACRTTCPYCGVGCGVLATLGPAGVAIAGDPDHPANYGRLCSKGSALGETVDLAGRLLTPQIGGKEATWDDAVALTARKFAEAIARHGPDSVAFYVSGQLLTEDYYIANKLMKGFIGSANIDTNSRLCMASSVAGHNRAFGADTVPGTYEDLEQADLIVLVGSNLAWCHPVLYQRIVAAKAARPSMRVVNIDPRRTATSDLADVHLGIAPGADVALFNRLLAEIERQGAIDAAYVEGHVTGLGPAIRAARGDDICQTGLDPALIQRFCDLWIQTEKVVTVYSQGVNQSSSGSDKVNAIINCHLATGRIGRPGMGPFSVTGQPNAMGGREVGGLANMLAAHLELGNQTHRDAVRTFWNAPAMPQAAGLKAVDLFRACAEGQIKALWIMSTNPAVSMPAANAVRDAIAGCPFVAVSDILPDTDTARLGDVLFPATAWGEKSGTVTNSDRTISRQRAFLPVPGAAKPDWQIICDVAKAMGWGEAFGFISPAEIFREHAALSGIAGAMGRDFDIGAFAGMTDADYNALAPARWPVAANRQGGRFFAEGGYFTTDRRARMVAVTTQALAAPLTPERPLRLNTGRIRDQWHTMTRTGRAPRLNQHLAEPFVEIHPDDAISAGIAAAELVRVETGYGQMVARALVTERTQPGSVFIPIHWTSAFASDGRVDALIAPVTDPVSGQPELKGAAASISRYDPAWYGFAVGAKRPVVCALSGIGYWALAPSQTGWRLELAGDSVPASWEQAAKLLFGAGDHARTVCAVDPGAGHASVVVCERDRTLGVLYADRQPVAVARSHVIAKFATLSPNDLLAGRPSMYQPDPGALVCACMGVGAKTIVHAIAAQGLTSVEAIGEATTAGTSCGSCRPELHALLAAHPVKLAAE
ncbi:MAG: molybdopterin-dependent oxidoreductase [Pseudomonadota bacterium]